MSWSKDNPVSIRGWHKECHELYLKECKKQWYLSAAEKDGKSPRPRLTKDQKLERLLEPKTCTKCGEFKSASDFYINKKRIVLDSWCKKCHKAACEASEEKNIEKYKKYQKKYQKTYLERKKRGEIKNINVFKELFKDKIENITDF